MRITAAIFFYNYYPDSKNLTATERKARRCENSQILLWDCACGLDFENRCGKKEIVQNEMVSFNNIGGCEDVPSFVFSTAQWPVGSK